MSDNFEGIFEGRKVPWEGLGTSVFEAKNSAEAIQNSGLDWEVEQREIVDSKTGEIIPKFLANVRASDDRVLGIVNGPKSEVYQNRNVFEFADKLLSEGEVSFESCGTFMGGKKIWLLAKLPPRDILGERYEPRLVFMNSHDGSAGIKVAVVPVRVAGNNTMNLALPNADRIWSVEFKGDLQGNLLNAATTLRLANRYLKSLEFVLRDLTGISLDDQTVERMIGYLLPIKNEEGRKKVENTKEMRAEIFARYKFAPDFENFDENAYRFVLAVSDFSIHTDIHRNTRYFDENRFMKVVSGGTLLIDKAYKLVER